MLKSANKISVIGGDMRQLYMAKELSQYNSEIYTYGLPNDKCEGINIFCCNSLEQSISYADSIILPLPTTKDNSAVISPLSDETILIDDIIRFTKDTGKLIFIGKASAELTNKLSQNGIRAIDYFADERLNIKNAMLTAEGAIATAIMETNFSIHGSECLVTGYGRIAKILSRLLSAMGAHVMVAARNPNDVAWAEINGYNAIKIEEIGNHHTAADNLD